MDELFKDSEYCKKQLVEARRIMGKKSLTKEKSEKLSFTLGAMYLYCPDDMKDIVYATLSELTRREQFLFGIKA